MSFSPSTRSMNKLPHKEMYKSPYRSSNIGSNSPVPNEKGLTESPSWRNAYKKRCFDEFKKSRQKLINRFRNCSIETKESKTKFKDYLEEELEKICLLEAQTESITIDEAIEIYKQIQDELIPNSFSDLTDEQIEDLLRKQEIEEKLNQDSILYVSSNKISQIFCPVCQKEFLIEENSMIYCKNLMKNACNFKIKCDETNLDLTKLSSRLEDAVKQHSCNEIPTFQFKTKETMDENDLILFNQLSNLPSVTCFLLMTCESCGFMQSII